MKLVVATTLLALLASPAVAKPIAPSRAPLPPPIVLLAEAIGAGNEVTVATVDAAGVVTPVLAGLSAGVYAHLAVDPGSGRWAIAAHQLDGGDPLVVDGTAHTVPHGPSAIVVGQLGQPAVTVLPGDPTCHGRKVACFETPVRFEADGEVLITHSESARWWMWNRRTVGAGTKAKPRAIIAKALTRRGTALAVGHDGARAVYATAGGFGVTAWPAQTRRKLGSVKAAKRVVKIATPLLGEPTLIGDHVFYFRRDADQATGVLAAWDLGASREVVLTPLPLPYPLWSHRFLAAPTRGTVVFQVDVGFERADLYEVQLGAPPRRLVGDVRELLDVSADGRYALAAAYRQPDAATRTDHGQLLVVVDLVAGTVLRRVETGLVGAKVYDARFVGR